MGQMLETAPRETLPTETPLSERRAVADERRVAAWIGKAVVVTGHVVCCEDLTIDGRVEGTIELGDHSLTIGVGARVKADLVAKNITISGTVTGNVLATDRVELQATGSVDGDISAPLFAMADGAVLIGRVDTRGHKTAPRSGA